ncbi:glycoside hydrolase family 68 protein [Limosilactobacillus sp. STM2_1]|uniref:Glycoside hydrolase family 68 protein n=1 Tax=Limosilactobacillus rudii TaxID=2759755 RepID=A0A7W3UMD9_9LACO|nr:glycoside hydrolase family 68 protein [Limosilactobacillus rudii]MBB1078878.1 glycoside hydrolase family 68 protein [Limosilactobacillus rudii]MBB1098246.1 glycoside hydrolase family 68 protein [Limosilactobacillus rudii]MCD7135639.1 glycoside hydrolase family 68 protein [Limosilactobacillus rudii]
MLERKEHKKMYKSGKNWAVVTLSTAALVLGASSITASANTTEKDSNNVPAVQVATDDGNVPVKSIKLGEAQSANTTTANSSAASSSASSTTNSSASAASSASDVKSASANSANDTNVAIQSKDDNEKAAPAVQNTPDSKTNSAATSTTNDNVEKESTKDETKTPTKATDEVKLNKEAATVVKNAGIDPASLTQDQVKALNKVKFSKKAKTGTQMTYSDFQKIADTLIKQDGRYAVPFFNAREIKNMPAATTKDAQTNVVQPLDVWDSWPVQDVRTGQVANWNGYQLVVAMMGVPNTNDNHIYLLYNKYGDNELSHWKNAGAIFGYNANAITQEWSGSAVVNSDDSIQLFYTKVDTSDNNTNHQKLASATLYLKDNDNNVEIANVANDHVIFEGDGYYYQTYAQWKATNKGADNIAMRDAHVIEDNDGNRYLVFEASTGLENYQGEDQIYNWVNYGGDDAFNVKSLFQILSNGDIKSRASWANAAIGILKLNNDEKNPSVAQLYSPILTAPMVSDEIERPNVVKLGNKYYLFAATRLNRGSNDDAWMKANYNVGDNVAMVGYVADSLTGEYKPLNESGVVLTASVPANWRTATYSYYAVPVAGKDDQLLVTSYMTNRNEVAGKGMDSTWAPSFLLQINPDNTTTVLAKMTNQGDWIWDDSSENLNMLGDLESAALPGEREKPVDWDLIGYGLKTHNPLIPQTPDNPGTPDTPGTPTTPETPNTPQTPGTPNTPTTPENPQTPSNPGTPTTPESPKKPATQDPRLPQTGNNTNKAVMGLGMATLLTMFGLAGVNKRRYY